MHFLGWLSLFISLTKQTMLVLSMFYSIIISFQGIENTSTGLEPRIVFRVYDQILVVSSQKYVILMSFFYN